MRENIDETKNLSTTEKKEKEQAVIADMSGLELRPGSLGRRSTDRKVAQKNNSSADIGSEGRMAAIKGALAATFMIYFIYAAAFGVFIFLLTKLI